MSDNPRVPRRAVLQAGSALIAAGLASRSHPGWATTHLNPTPACDDDDGPTPAQTEGPFFSPNSPKRSDFLQDGPGTPVVVTGLVLTRACRTVPGALVELWHADAHGIYDNEGYRFRGHQFADADGLYRFTTIVPGLYPGRTRHYHVKYQAPGQPVLTTQLYFPDEPENARDRIFRPELLLSIERGNPAVARFDAVLDIA